MVVTGVLSDGLKVRKPFMLVGGLVSAVGVALFAIATGDPATSYNHFLWIILLIAVGGAIAFAAWMASFTETVEEINPAGTATGLAVWGATLRSIVVLALIGLIFAIPSAGMLIDKGAHVGALAASKDPSLTATRNATVKAVAADPTIVLKVQSSATRYKTELGTAALLKPATTPTLAATPNDPATQATAVGEIAHGLGIAPGAAIARLQALAQVPPADLQFLGANAAPVQATAARLTALGAVPAADLALLSTYGPGLKDPKVVAALTYLQKEAPGVQQAAKNAPGDWQRWGWICFAGQLVFLPFIWLVVGRWSPANAGADAQAHDEAVSRELSALSADSSTAEV